MPENYNTQRSDIKQDKKENTNKRYVAEQHHGWGELTPEMKSFWGEFVTDSIVTGKIWFYCS